MAQRYTWYGGKIGEGHCARQKQREKKKGGFYAEEDHDLTHVVKGSLF